MAFVHGKTCEIAVDQYTMTGIFKGATFTADVDTAETTVFGLSDKTFDVGNKMATVALDGFYDNSRQTEVEARIGVTPYVATVGPAGLAVGARARLLGVNTTNVTETSGIGDMVLLSWALSSTDRVGLGYSLLNGTTALSGDTNGTAVDTGAAVSGALWTAHFHLHSISATNVVITVQDSADGSTGWANITSVTSGTLTGVGAVRVTGTGTTKRYVRASVDFTGGASTGTATVAFARQAP